MNNNYPEHEKMKAISNESQTIGEFLEWLDGEGFLICEAHGDEFFPVPKRPDQILADHFGIDLVVIEQEKRTMLEEIRRMNDE